MNLYEKIDRLGQIKAEIADLAKEQKKLQGEVLNQVGFDKVDGYSYTLTIYETIRSYLDMDAVRRKLSRQFLVSHTTEKPVTNFKLTARQIERRAA